MNLVGLVLVIVCGGVGAFWYVRACIKDIELLWATLQTLAVVIIVAGFALGLTLLGVLR